MTWQRIDENTYIDDTLVTCAEYQLFIDEMRVQGKYYQPDHWTSYQFPEGQAREPILGVRHSDAVAFCEWLSRREISNLLFRVPSSCDASQIAFFITNARLAGYWVLSNEHHSQKFQWIGDLPVNARVIKLENVVAYANKLNLKTALNSIRNLEGFSIQSNQLSKIARSLDRILKQTIDIDPSSDGIVDKAFTRAESMSLEHAFKQSCNSPIDLDSDRSHIPSIDLENVPRFSFLQFLESVLRHYRDTSFNFDDAMDLFHRVFIDLFTLQERIAGRSPAFEGIRLVKERTR